MDTESRAEVTEAVLAALLGAAGPEGAAIHVAFRIYPEKVEVDVLRTALEQDQLTLPPAAPAFSSWMSNVLSRKGLSQEAAARELGVSVRTVSRWVAGDTEPRLRELRRIKDVFGEIPIG
jgi:DNA-binding transcriptional regulator YiaG